jgi:hypothetical protein
MLGREKKQVAGVDLGDLTLFFLCCRHMTYRKIHIQKTDQVAISWSQQEGGKAWSEE